MDRFSRDDRSAVMARVGSEDSAPELAVRRELHRRGLRYSLHRKDLPGKPDVVFRNAQTVLFIHGCFWHLHSCKRGRLPKSNRRFWRKKLEANRERDARQIRLLRGAGWKVIVIWTCRVSTKLGLTRACDRVEAVVRQRRRLPVANGHSISATAMTNASSDYRGPNHCGAEERSC